MKDILKAVVEVTKISESDILGDCRETPIVEARFLFYFVSREKKYTLRDLGTFTNRKHSSVSSLITRHERQLDTDPVLSSKYNKILEITGLEAIEDEIEIHPLWNESFYIADMSSRFFGKYFIGMENGIPVSYGSFYKVANEMIGRYGTK